MDIGNSYAWTKDTARLQFNIDNNFGTPKQLCE